MFTKHTASLYIDIGNIYTDQVKQIPLPCENPNPLFAKFINIHNSPFLLKDYQNYLPKTNIGYLPFNHPCFAIGKKSSYNIIKPAVGTRS